MPRAPESKLPSPPIAHEILAASTRSARLHPHGPHQRLVAPISAATVPHRPAAPEQAPRDETRVAERGDVPRHAAGAVAAAEPTRAPAHKTPAAGPHPHHRRHGQAAREGAAGPSSPERSEGGQTSVAAFVPTGMQDRRSGDSQAPGAADSVAPTPGGGRDAALIAGGAALHMPEPPSGPSAATMRRIHGVQARAGRSAKAHAALPAGDHQVGDARGAVTEPDAQALARAKAELIRQVKAEPSQEIVKLCERIRTVIRNKRPPDEDALAEANPEGEALNAGNELNSTIGSETKKVQDNYGPVDSTPPDVKPTAGAELPPQPGVAATPALNASNAVPDAVPAKDVSLAADVDANQQRIQGAGMDTPAAQLVQTGPIAEARGAQGELVETAKEDPAKVLAAQQAALGKADADMTALQSQALDALTQSRAATAMGATKRQHAMIGSEADQRAKAGTEAKKTFDDAKVLVDALLKPLATNAMAKWEAAKTILVAQFKADLAIVQKRVDDRHSGVSGFVVGLWDAVTGLPGWAEDAYTRAETNFGDGVIAKLTEISTEVNAVIAACDIIIKNAREKISTIFADLPPSLREWADGEKAKFNQQLDTLHNQAIAARDSFNKDLISRSSQAVDEVRTEIAELRKKAAGLVGRIVNAVQRFLDDPVKFLIEGLLEILGISPAAFWAVVAKIKKVIKDIANDPLKFADNLLSGLAQGFSQFFDHILKHLLKGFISWLTGSLGDVGVQLPKDASPKSLITFFLQLMGITWPRIRKILAKHVGEKNVKLLEKVYTLVSFLIEKGPEGIYELIKEKLNPQAIVDQVVNLAVDYMITAVVKAVSVRILLLFNPAGAILQALEAIYKVLKWVFENAARIFTLIETVVNGIADILAGSLGAFANAVETALEMLIAPVISFLADYLGFGDLPAKIAEQIKSFQDVVLKLIEEALVWIIEKGKALLSAIGLGRKDRDKKQGEDEEIGERMEVDAETETHELWIEGHGSSLHVVIASRKETVAAMLKRFRAQRRKGGAKLLDNAEAALAELTSDAENEDKEIEASKSNPEGSGSTGHAGLQHKTVSAETKLALALKAVFKFYGVAEQIRKYLGSQQIDRNVPDGDDALVNEFAKDGAPDGYSVYQLQLKTVTSLPRKYYIRRVEKPDDKEPEETRPQVHFDEDGILQIGPSRDSMDEEEKIAAYNALLRVLFPRAKLAIKSADAARDTARQRIVAKLAGQDQRGQKIVAFMKSSEGIVSTVFNGFRGDIYEQAVSQHPLFKFQRSPRPRFLVSRYPVLEHDRIADGSRSDTLIEAKSHVSGGPGAHDVGQNADYRKILGNEQTKGKPLREGSPPGGKTYADVVYIILSYEARQNWTAIEGPGISIEPTD